VSIIPPGYASISVELHHTLQSRSAFLTWGCRIDGGLDVALVALNTYTAVTEAGAGKFLSGLDSSVTVPTCTAHIGQDGGDPLVFQASGAGVGGVALTSPPANVALLCRKRTNRGGRRGRGRIYLPWYTNQTQVDEAGKVSAGTVTATQSAMVNLLTKLTTNNVPMVVLHSPSSPNNKKGPTTPGAPDLVTSVSVDSLIATQRRRLGR
jgi:hypothetical protein